MWPICKTNLALADLFSALESQRDRQSVTTKVNKMIRDGFGEDYAASANKTPSVYLPSFFES